MNRANRKYVIVLVLCFAGLIVTQLLVPKPINWTESYSKKDKIPYGTSALYSVLPDLFPEQQISDETMPVYNSLNESSSGNYIAVNVAFRIDSLDRRTLFDFVKRGNNAFIAAADFNGAFGDSLKLDTDNFLNFVYKNKKDSLAAMSTMKDFSQTINFTNPALKKENGYEYSKCFDNTYFISFDTSKVTVLGIDKHGKVNFISMKMGKGMLYISTVPEAFCNYNVVHPENQEYTTKALSYLPKRDVIWDEYYKVNNKTQGNILRVIFNNSALSMAYGILMITLLCFMIFGAKRRQRIIPVIEPLQNTTLQFVDIVGTLYYQTGDHKNIADKKITYFLEYIRSAFQVKTNVYDAVFIERITNLSGIEKEKVQELFMYFTFIQSHTSITQQELIKLNSMIEAFHKLNKR